MQGLLTTISKHNVPKKLADLYVSLEAFVGQTPDDRVASRCQAQLQVKVSAYIPVMAGMLLLFHNSPHGGNLRAQLVHISPNLKGCVEVLEDLTTFGQELVAHTAITAITKPILEFLQSMVKYLAEVILCKTLEQTSKVVLQLLQKGDEQIPADYTASIQTNRLDKLTEIVEARA